MSLRRSSPVEPVAEGGPVVEPAVLADRRVKRAEFGARAQAQRASEAEEAFEALQGEVDTLELRLAQAIDARRRLEDELGARERELVTRERELAAELQRETAARSLLIGAVVEVEAALDAAEARLAGVEAAIGETLEAADAPSPAPNGNAVARGHTSPASLPSALEQPEPADRGDWLRSALPALAARDPRTAAVLMCEILPFCLRTIEGVLPFDLALAELGLLGFSASDEGVVAEALPRPRGRRDRSFLFQADAVVIAALIAGRMSRRAISRRAGRPARETFLRARRARRLGALADVPIGLAALSRGGVRLDPSLVYRALACAIPVDATAGLAFTVAHMTTGDRDAKAYVTALPGAGIVVSDEAPGAVDAVVTTTSDALLAVLANDPTGPAKPAIRGDAAAVQALASLVRSAQAPV
ncbi:MAG: hypothetical protein ACR2HD_10750 [Solirubrobacteraceae bacterium]